MKTFLLAAVLGFSGTAIAAGVGESCDRNQGDPCDATAIDYGIPPSHEYAWLFCNPAGFYGGFECTFPWDGGPFQREAIPNGNVCLPSPPSTATCASGHCLSNGLNYNNQTGMGDAGGICCAGPGQALTQNPNFMCMTYTAALMPFPLIDYEEPTNPYNMGCYYPGNWTGGHFVPSGYYLLDGGACAEPDQPTVDIYWQFVDAGTNPLGGIQHLMRTDPLLYDAGISMSLPLGFFPPFGYSDHTRPNYVCEPQFYNQDGTLTLQNVGRGNDDLMECGGQKSDEPSGGYFPCCGEMHDGGGYPSLCQPEFSHGGQVNHCVCIQDGNECDRPRYLDATHYDGVETRLGAGECCSPGLTTQVYDPNVPGHDGGTATVIVKGQGWCRAAHGVNPYGGDVGSDTVAGYCNCLPSGVNCGSDSDCCGFDGGQGGNICNGSSGTCKACVTIGQHCTSNADCCRDHPTCAIPGQVCL